MEVSVMSEQVSSVYDWQHIEIYARQIIGKKAFREVSTFWREKPADESGRREKLPVRLYIINYGSKPAPSPEAGYPVKTVKLCKRAVFPDYPKNTVTGTRKSRITHRYYLVLLVEYENGEFMVINLPRQLSAPGSYREGITLAFSNILGSDGKAPVPQHMNAGDISEKLSVIPESGSFSAFEYMMAFPVSAFGSGITIAELDNPTLQSTIILSNLKYDSDVGEPVLIPAGEESFIWTTAVDFMLYEDIHIKLGVDQDIVVQGMSEL